MDIIEDFEKLQQRCIWNSFISEVALHLITKEDNLCPPQVARIIFAMLYRFLTSTNQCTQQNSRSSDASKSNITILGLSYDTFSFDGLNKNDQKLFRHFMEKLLRSLHDTDTNDGQKLVTQTQHAALLNSSLISLLQHCLEFFEIWSSCKDSLENIYQLRMSDAVEYFKNMVKTYGLQIDVHNRCARSINFQVSDKMRCEAPLFSSALKILSDCLTTEAETLKKEIEDSKRLLKKYAAIKGSEFDSIVSEYRCVQKHRKHLPQISALKD